MIEIGDIKRVLPHRFPMLLVDRVVEVVPGQRLTARKAITANEPWYAALGDAGAPEAHAYPQALLIESWGQAAGLLAAWDQRNPDVLAGQVMLFGSMTGVRFHRPVLPGDVLEHRVRAVRRLSDAAIFEGESFVGSSIALEVERVVMALRPADVLRPAMAASPG